MKIVFACAAMLLVQHHPSAIALNLTHSIGYFSSALFDSQTRAEPHTSHILSPLSVFTGLCMSLLGARGKTAQEIKRTLQFPETQSRTQLGAAFRHLLQPLQRPNSNLKVVNKIYVRRGHTVQSEFQSRLVQSFFSTLQPLDLSSPSDAAGIINRQVAADTDNRITDLISPKVLTNNTNLLLINAVYFKAKWAFLFPKESTYEELFFLETRKNSPWARKTVRLAFMHTTRHFRYGQRPDLDAVIVELPYKNDDFVMNIILPHEHSGGLSRLMKRLIGLDLSQLTRDHLWSTKIELAMPKFQSRQRYSLKASLMELGIRTAFTGTADFSDMLNDSRDLAVDAVIHEAFIEVDEEGTQAAAATGVVMGLRRSGTVPMIIKLNHPFVYFIQDHLKNVLFVGQFTGE